MDPHALRPHYARFLRDDRVLLTGHSHQAWPDVAREGVLEAYDDAAAHVDDKWAAASEAADVVRAAIAGHVGAQPDEIALGQNTHELVTRWLSALDLRARPHVVTTDGEFHSLRRQLTRLEEEGLRVTWVAPEPFDTLTARLAEAIEPDTAGLAFSTVLFETSAIVPALDVAIDAARAVGAEVLLDTYHAHGAIPFRLRGDVFATGGGYKYLQWGEGNCWLRVPASCDRRPVFTGWFSDFANLAAPRGAARVGYGSRPADRFAGSTYDPTSHYRARRVIRFFEEQGLTIDRLRERSLVQTARIRDGLEGWNVRTPEARGGFVTVELDDASGTVARLRERGVFVDARGRLLRFGPAPYVTDDEIERALAAFREVAR
ncbi:MAG: kynureninase [Sandaracinaceae bacterium]|nr:kynureninase [Sandaracinaceae bacterium]